MDIYFVNESTLLNDKDAFNIAWACDYQARFHIGRSGWRSDVRGIYLPGGGNAVIPRGGRVMHLLDTADQQGALGYHDEDGNEVAFGRVFIKTARDNGSQPSAVASHETAELIGDEHVNLTAATGDLKRLYPVELGDPVQGNDYDIGAPQGRTTGILVADFALPSWFDPRTAADRPTSYRGSVKGAFSLAPQGYYSYLDLTNVSAGWQQAWGQARTSAPSPDGDDRLRRRGVVPV